MGHRGSHPFGQAKVDAGEAPEHGEAGLDRGDVHHRQAAVLRDAGQVADHSEAQVSGADLDLDLVPDAHPQGRLCPSAEKQTVVGQGREAIGLCRRSGQQGRCYPGQGEDVEAQQLQGLFRPGQLGFHLDHRTGLGDLGAAGE